MAKRVRCWPSLPSHRHCRWGRKRRRRRRRLDLKGHTRYKQDWHQTRRDTHYLGHLYELDYYSTSPQFWFNRFLKLLIWWQSLLQPICLEKKSRFFAKDTLRGHSSSRSDLSFYASIKCVKQWESCGCSKGSISRLVLLALQYIVTSQ